MKAVKIAVETMSTKVVSPLNKSLENPVRNASYIARDTKAETTSHEHAAVNPILGKTPEKAFQHPTYTKILCAEANCDNNLCKEPCGPTIASIDVAHATHDASVPKAAYVAEIALDGKTKTQYGVFYENPIAARDADIAKTINLARTEQLNNDDVHLVNIHANAKVTSINDESFY